MTEEVPGGRKMHDSTAASVDCPACREQNGGWLCTRDPGCIITEVQDEYAAKRRSAASRHDRLVAEAEAKATDLLLTQLQETGRMGVFPGWRLSRLLAMLDTLGIQPDEVELWGDQIRVVKS